MGEGILTLAGAGILAFVVGCIKHRLWLLAAWGLRLWLIFVKLTWRVLPYYFVYDALEALRQLYHYFAPAHGPRATYAVHVFSSD